MEEWLKQINPNVLIPSVIIPLLGWLWHHRKNLKADMLDTVDAAVTTEVHLIMDDRLSREQAQKLLLNAAWMGLGKLGVHEDKAPDWVKKLVAKGAEEGLAELAEKLHERDLAKIAAGTQAVKDAFIPPVRPGVPKLDIDIEEDTSPESKR